VPNTFGSIKVCTFLQLLLPESKWTSDYSSLYLLATDCFHESFWLSLLRAQGFSNFGCFAIGVTEQTSI